MTKIEQRYHELEVELRLRLAEPGILKGKQRGQTFIDKVVVAALRLFRSHGFAKHEHTFPIARLGFSSMVGLCQWTIRRVIPILTKIDFVNQVGQTVRRCHNGTKSPTDGAKTCWFAPGQFRLASWVQEWLHAEITRLPLENHKALDDTQNVSKEEGKEEGKIDLGSKVQGFMPQEAPEIAQEAPTRRRGQVWEPTRQDVLDALRDESVEPVKMTLSAAAMAIFRRGKLW